jgi:hypothetical protein
LKLLYGSWSISPTEFWSWNWVTSN